MLSRVAENIYWMARYIERAENTARLVNVTSNLLLDLPSQGCADQQCAWSNLIAITGNQEGFTKRQLSGTEENVTRFLLVDRENPFSMASAIQYARANLRTSRENFPKEAWEYLNDIHLLVSHRLPQEIQGANRYQDLMEVIRGCQTFTGMLFSSMSRDWAFEFFRMGQNLERADMTTRILDARASALEREQANAKSSGIEPLLPFVNVQWLSVLRSVSGEMMYRRHHNPRVQGAEVVTFLLKDRRFPRAFAHSAGRVDECLAKLVRNHHPRALIYDMLAVVDQADPHRLLEHGLHQFLDDLQIQLGRLHDLIAATYFTTSHPEVDHAA